MNQEAIFNIGEINTEFTGGDGESPIEDTDDLKRLLNELDNDALSQKKMKQSEPFGDVDFVTEDGQSRLSASSIMIGAQKGDFDVETVTPGQEFVVDGVTYTRADNDTGSDGPSQG